MSLLLVPAPLGAKASLPPATVSLSNEHRNASESFRFRTPASWTVETLKESPELLEARGDGVLVRFLHRSQEAGYDSLHADCMLERLTEAMDMEPEVRVEALHTLGRFQERRKVEFQALADKLRLDYEAALRRKLARQ